MDLLTVQTPFLANVVVEGYEYNRLKYIFLSASDISFPSLTAINNFTNIRRVSAICPEFSGYNVPLSAYNIIDKNHLALSAAFLRQYPGTMDVIFYNDAGYTKLSDSGILLNIVVTEEDIVLIDGEYVVTIQDNNENIILI